VWRWSRVQTYEVGEHCFPYPGIRAPHTWPGQSKAALHSCKDMACCADMLVGPIAVRVRVVHGPLSAWPGDGLLHTHVDVGGAGLQEALEM
jgi:hypothetical protein